MREISPAADPQSRTFRVKLSLTQPDADVRLGMTGEATLEGATPAAGANEHTFVLPATSLAAKCMKYRYGEGDSTRSAR